jgi:hypothetical protein
MMPGFTPIPDSRQASHRVRKCQQPTRQSAQQGQPQRIGAGPLDLGACYLTTAGPRRWFPRAVEVFMPLLSTRASRYALPPFRLGRQKARQDWRAPDIGADG